MRTRENFMSAIVKIHGGHGQVSEGHHETQRFASSYDAGDCGCGFLTLRDSAGLGLVSGETGSAMPRQPSGTCISLQTLREPGGRLAAKRCAFHRESRHCCNAVRSSRVVFHRVVVSTYEGIARLDKRGLAWRVRARVGGTLVFFKGLLCEAVECQRGNGAFETRSGHAPWAVGAAPAGEVVAFDPDQPVDK